MKRLPLGTVLIGDVRERLTGLPAASVDCVITSPPYFRLRDYGMSGQIGLEETVDGWVDELRLTFRGLARVLKPTGSVWLNLGDSYSRHPRSGAPAKSLLLGPERLALALLADGWTVRNKVVWAKTNTMPTSVRDRLSCQWEVLYLLTRSRHYFFDLDAIRVPHRSGRAGHRRAGRCGDPDKSAVVGRSAGRHKCRAGEAQGERDGRTPIRQESGGRLDDGFFQLPRSTLRHFPRVIGGAAIAGQLPGAGLSRLRGTVATRAGSAGGQSLRPGKAGRRVFV